MFQGIPALMVSRSGATGGGGGSSLLSGLQAYYKLEDETDSSGNGLTLTNHNVAAFGAGKVNNAVTFVAGSNQWLDHADAAQYQVGVSSFSFCAWVKFTVTVDSVMVSYGGPGDPRWSLNGANGDRMRFEMNDGVNGANCDSDGGGVVMDGNWHFYVGTVDRALNLITLLVDNGAIGSQGSVDCSVVTGTLNNTTGFALGKFFTTQAGCSVDEVGLWNRVITGTEKTALWNGGAGTTYPTF